MSDPSYRTWAIGLVVGLPLAVVILSEVHLRLRRRGSPLAGPVNGIRILLLPLTALLILLTKAAEVSDTNNGVRLVATVVGVGVVTTALGVLNAVLFGNAARGTWRDRLPAIFVDLARLILVAAGAAIVASFVWGLNVSGLFAALGVGSIVIGLALQNAVGSVVSGLLLLFEQPFRIGDSLQVEGVTGNVVEMNWRSTHLDVGTGVQVVPNARLAVASFTNQSRPTPAHDLIVATAFSSADPPHRVMAMLLSVAQDVSNLRPDATPSVAMTGDGTYATRLPLATATASDDARSQFLTWVWYAARREGLAHGGEPAGTVPRDQVTEAIHRMLATLDLSDGDIEAIARVAEIEVFGNGEHVIRIGEVSQRVGYVLHGTVSVLTTTHDGSVVLVADLDAGEQVGTSAIIREPSQVACVARGAVEILQVPVEVVDRLLAARPDIARRLNAMLATQEEQRVATITGSIASAGQL